jgi:integrase
MEYVSTFALHIIDLIKQKRTLGYKYGSEPAILRRFDKFCREQHPNEHVLNQKVMMAWATKRPGEHPATLQNRLAPVRELAKYMARQGLDAYIMPKGLLPRVPRYKPHIYSNDELQRIFEQTDKCRYCSQVPFRHLVMPVFFRLLYCTGMRLSEARLLKVGDVNLDSGVITVTNTKLDKHRQLPVSPEMLTRLAAYHQNIHALSKPEDCFFPGFGGKPMTMGNVEKNLRKFLWKASISHGGRGKGPRVHDFRHTFAVHCLQKWIRNGVALSSALPRLTVYLGHKDMTATEQYLRMTAEVYPEISETLSKAYGHLIPKMEVSV